MLTHLVRRLCAGLRVAIARNEARGDPCDPKTLFHLTELERFAAGDDARANDLVDETERVVNAWCDEAKSALFFHARHQTAEAVYLVACLASGEGDDTLQIILEQVEALARVDDEQGRGLNLVADAMGCRISDDGQRLDAESLEEAARAYDA